jgi:hypothetical protein
LESHALKVASVEHVSHEANVNQFLLGEEPQITSEDASTEQHPLQKLIVLVVLVFLLVLVFSSEARRSVMDWTNELGLTSFASSEPSESPDASAVAPLEGAASETNANTASVAPTAAAPVGAASSAATAAPSSTTNVNASSAPKDKPAAVSAPTVNAAEAPNKSISANVSPAPNVAVQNPQ